MSEQKNLISAVASLVSMSNEKYEATRSELYKSGEARSESFRNFLDKLFKVADEMRAEA